MSTKNIRHYPSDSRNYLIVVRGECGPLLESSIDDVETWSSSGQTAMLVKDADQSRLNGVINRLHSLMCEMISISEVTPDR